MTRKSASAASIALVGATAVLAFYISYGSALRYVLQIEPAPPPIIANLHAEPFLLIHVVSSMVALMIGPLQFVQRIRARWPRTHRRTGRLYVIACAIGAPTGLVLALGTVSGPIAGAGFAVMAMLWALYTALGLRAAIGRRFGPHREWMLRSYALAAGAITLRVMLPAAMAVGLEFSDAYPVIAWLDWIVNLALVELYIRRRRGAAASARGTLAVA